MGTLYGPPRGLCVRLAGSGSRASQFVAPGRVPWVVALMSPMTLGQALTAHKSYNHRTEPDIATQSHTTAPVSGLPVIDWARLLRCTECGVRDADFVVTGERR